MGAVSNPLVSVIIPVLNGERYLAQALRSVFAQEYSPLEVIVADGRSTDNTVDVARSFPDVHCFVQQGPGLGSARNEALAMARGDLIAFLDHDDVWAPEKLRVQVAFLEAHPDAQYTVCQVRVFMDEGYSDGRMFRPQALSTGQVGEIPCTMLARKEVFAEVGDFDATLGTACDLDWMARARDRGIPMEVIPHVLVHKRIHAHNLSADLTYVKETYLEVIRRSLQRKAMRGASPEDQEPDNEGLD
jgi:glycosyltransferase involved in cell wall biosynthesis